jgi:putative ABC transport system permease protein
VAASAPVYAGEVRDAELPNGDFHAIVYVIDAAELHDVQNDPATAIPLPDGLVSSAESGPVPVIASQRLTDLTGAESLTIAGEEVDILSAAPTATPLGPGSLWVAVDRSQASRLVTTVFSPGVVLLELEPGADVSDVSDAALEIAGGAATASTPASIAEVRTQDPALTGVRGALVVAIGAVTLLLALAIGMTLVLGAPARGRLLALLGALGFRRSRELPIILWEVAPAVAVALPVGLGVGLLLPFVVIPAVDLTGFVGGAVQPAVHLGGWAPVLVAAGFLGVTALAVLVAAVVARSVTAARTLRSIDEEG